MDYFRTNLYNMDRDIPDWLIQPPPLQPYLVKHEYETKFTYFA